MTTTDTTDDLFELRQRARQLDSMDSRRVACLDALSDADHLAQQYQRKVEVARRALEGGGREPAIR